jgi:hypothetical protein
MGPTEAAEKNATTNAATNGTTSDAEKPTGTRRGRGAKKDKGEDKDTYIYCLDAGKGESGVITLSKPGPKKDILVQSIKSGVYYFRIQRFKASVEDTEDGKFEIVEKLAE